MSSLGVWDSPDRLKCSSPNFVLLHLYMVCQDVNFFNIQIPDLSNKSGIWLLNKKTQAERKINFAWMIISDNLLNKFISQLIK
ncbi:hypothetical protein [Nostoc sp.]|uniref:hypothetical protein n=1 Tax=Nostoc sp. TaxID=1180 RepID=UPI002FF6F778